MDYLAGIDLGSTSLKCVIYDLDWQCCRQRQPSNGTFSPESCSPGMDGLGARADLGRDSGGHEGSGCETG